MTTHPSTGMPPHGRAAWDGTAGLGASGDVHAILTGDRNPITVGAVVWTQADDGAKGGMVIEIEVNLDGERILTVLTHNQERVQPRAWTFQLPESDFDPTKTVPDNGTRRHGYAKACYLAAAHGRYVTEADLRLAGIAAGLVHDHLAGAK